jgi:hypothetical protein
MGLVGCKNADSSPEGEARFYSDFPAAACKAMACPNDSKAVQVLTCLVQKREPGFNGAVAFADLCARARNSDPAGAAGPYRNYEGCVAFVSGWFEDQGGLHDYWQFLGYPIAQDLVDECD